MLRSTGRKIRGRLSAPEQLDTEQLSCGIEVEDHLAGSFHSVGNHPLVHGLTSADVGERDVPGVRAIEGLADDPRLAGATKLVGEETAWRIRVGDYRVIYDVLDEALVVTVVRVRHRREVYVR